MLRLITISILILFSASAAAKPESWYIDRYCRQKFKGVPEYTLPNQRRIDCLTDTHALEFGFLTYPIHDIGQALYYAHEAGKLPGIVWIVRKKSDYKTIKEMKATCEQYGIKVHTIRAKRSKFHFDF